MQQLPNCAGFLAASNSVIILRQECWPIGKPKPKAGATRNPSEV